MIVRQDLDEVARGRVVEAHRAADQRRGRAAAAVAQDLVALADLLALEVEDPGRGDAGLAAQHVPLAVRHQREVAAREQRGVGLARLEPEPRPTVTTWNQM